MPKLYTFLLFNVMQTTRPSVQTKILFKVRFRVLKNITRNFEKFEFSKFSDINNKKLDTTKKANKSVEHKDVITDPYIIETESDRFINACAELVVVQRFCPFCHVTYVRNVRLRYTYGMDTYCHARVI